MRRFSAVLRHREVGFGANAMGAWVVPPERRDAFGRAATARTNEQDELTVGHVSQESFDEGSTEEAGGAGDGDALPREPSADHVALSTKW